ncbi:diaminopimelate epimerase [Candidatus Entotheonella palauensis]|uniref:Diaminopimelate epimerase n=1 Tax=Candidatus Entotheonella gemina TaxID=1429439 RepID=W4MB70_9BACT|nr:diaminopimelate epimerase [Candidatus Entotheonella palauensis]ETX07614.1 MAG: diaminopimelate epimerase [Candidatus Entotheonella gemina]
MQFTKMHGLGNDYIYVNGFEEQLADPATVARAVSDRHFGIGGDGLILILPSTRADCRMRMFNADGSEAQMCGNGIRCLAKYVYEHDIARQTDLRVETLAGVLSLELFPQAANPNHIEQVRVNMGEPRLQREDIPMKGAPGQVLRESLDVDGTPFEITAVSMGNPHCIVFIDDPQSFDVAYWGPKFERHPAFPEGVNTEFVRVLDNRTFQMRVWERGSGETLACGTGASAVAVACHLNGKTARRLTGHLLGGALELEWNEADNHVYMTGPAVEVFSGEWHGQGA